MRLLAKLFTVLVCVGGVTALHADTTPGALDEPAVQKEENLSPAEMTSRTEKIRTGIVEDSRRMLYLREQAKKQKDVIKLSCVNDKIVQLKAEMNIAQTTGAQLDIAITADDENRKHLFVELTTTAESIKRLREEANACIGEPELYKQESGVEVTEPVIVDDPNVDPFGVGVEPPAYASPFI
jgi:hypothetical protein